MPGIDNPYDLICLIPPKLLAAIIVIIHSVSTALVMMTAVEVPMGRAKIDLCIAAVLHCVQIIPLAVVAGGWIALREIQRIEAENIRQNLALEQECAENEGSDQHIWAPPPVYIHKDIFDEAITTSVQSDHKNRPN